MDAFIKGSSSNSDIRELLLCFEKLECNGSHWPWFSRVPSASNCADDPTRVGRVLDAFARLLDWSLRTSWARRKFLEEGLDDGLAPLLVEKDVVSFSNFSE